MAKARSSKTSRTARRRPKEDPGTLGGPDPREREEREAAQSALDPRLSVATDKEAKTRRVVGKVRDDHWEAMRPFVAQQKRAQQDAELALQRLSRANEALNAMIVISSGSKNVKLDAGSREYYVEE